MATYNSVAFINKAIESFLEQDLDSKELVIIDGGSTDGTVEVLTALNLPEIRHISERDRGIYDAWNKGVKLAQGKWVHFLGSDDHYLAKNVLSSVAEILEVLPPQISMLSTSIVVQRGQQTIRHSPGTLEGTKFGILRSSTMKFSPHPGIFHRRSSFDALGFFDSDFKIAGDYELVARWLKSSDIFAKEDLSTVLMQGGGVSDRIKSSFNVLLELVRARRNNGLNPFDPAFFPVATRYALRGVLFKVFGEYAGSKILNNLVSTKKLIIPGS
jgi:glycosyltransferase involved in cell wall biosynthesis